MRKAYIAQQIIYMSTYLSGPQHNTGGIIGMLRKGKSSVHSSSFDSFSFFQSCSSLLYHKKEGYLKNIHAQAIERPGEKGSTCFFYEHYRICSGF